MSRLTCLAVALAAAGGAAAVVAAADGPLPRVLHPWGQSSAGAWKMVRVVSKCMDESGAVTRSNTTETKTTLQQIDDTGVTLQVNSVVEFLGKRFESDGQLLRQGFHGEAEQPNMKVQALPASQVLVEGKPIPCSVAQIELGDPDSKTVTTLCYSTTVAPYILKRETLVTDASGKQEVSHTTTEVVALNMPCEVLSDVKCTAQVRTLYKHAKGSIATLSFVSSDVPGGVVTSSSKELDQDGRLARVSVLKLVGYSFEPEEERPGLFGRKRSSRYRTLSPPTK